MKHSIIVALDEHNQEKFDDVLSQLDPGLCMVKIGSVSFNSLGRECLVKAAEKGFGIFLDLKLHDIPNTVKKSINGLVDLPIKMMTVHASGGQKMLEESVAATMNTEIKIFGVTALTSLSDTDTNFIYKREAKEQVLAMTELAKKSSIHGVVCSPQELSLVKNNSNLLGHPVINKNLGIEFSNGSLGMGLSLGIGTAISLHKKKYFHRVQCRGVWEFSYELNR